jgi:hypothetical protein
VNKSSTVIFIFQLFIASYCIGGEAEFNADGGVSWKAGVDGVEIEWNPNGSVKRLYSRHGVPVEFSDRRGIAKAQIIAEEKAKGNIIRFMEQDVTTTRVVAELQSDINRATQRRQTGKETVVNKIDDRTIVESLSEVTTSFASGTLRGVIVLERGFDDKLDEAWVVVGISEKTIAASRAAEDMLKNSQTKVRDSDGTALGVQGGEVRKSNNKDW